MSKDFPVEAYAPPGQTEAFPSEGFTPKVVPMAPASNATPRTPWLVPVKMPGQGM